MAWDGPAERGLRRWRGAERRAACRGAAIRGATYRRTGCRAGLGGKKICRPRFRSTRFQRPPRSTGPGQPPCTLSKSRRTSGSPRLRTKRRLAGDDSKRCLSGRNSTPSEPPASAASFKRLNQRSSVPLSHSKTAAQTPELKACSAAHNASTAVFGRTTKNRPNSIPCCAKAGA